MSKTVFDVIHGYIELGPHLIQIVDTHEFQRLRYIKQLGATTYVFPSANHTRFEHSLGVCHLAGKMIRSLKKNHQEEVDITERKIQLIEIAALIHDIGHGPFSHLWDHYVIYDTDDEHEIRGLYIFEKMIEKYDLPINKKEFQIICELVNPTFEENKNNWYYQIVANKKFQVDVDKIDYIQRDSYYTGIIGRSDYDRIITGARIIMTPDNTLELGWSHKLDFELFSIFTNRFKLHKLIYNHHTVKSHEYIIIDILKKFYSKYMEKSLQFTDLTDNLIVTPYNLLSENCPSTDYDITIHDVIRARKLPKFLAEFEISKSSENYSKIMEKIKMQHFPQYKVDLLIDVVKINFSSSDYNPMDKIYYYNKNFEGYHSETHWCKTEFHEVIIRCYLLGEITEEKKEKNMKFWEMYLEELNN